MIRSDLCNYTDACIFVGETSTITGERHDDVAKKADEGETGVIFKNVAPFTKCISSINNPQIDNAEDIDVVMPMYNLIEYSDNYSETSGRLWQFYRDESNDNITESRSSMVKITGKTRDNGNTKKVEIVVLLNDLGNFWRTFEMSLINCEISIDLLTWSKKCVISYAVGTTEFKITDTKRYVPVVTLSTEDNVKLLKQLESGFKRTIIWNKYHPKWKTFPQKRYLIYLIDPIFHWVNRFFVLPFENETDRAAHTKYYLPTVEIKYLNVIVDVIFDQPIKNDFKTYDNIRKIETGQGNNYTTGCWLDYNYFEEYYKLIAIDLSKQQKLDADLKAIQQNNFNGNLEKDASIFAITEETKEIFSKGTVKVLWFYFILIIYWYKIAQYNNLNIKLSNSQLNNLKSAIKNETEVNLNLSSNLIENSNSETNIPHKLLLTDKQVSKIRKAFGSANIKPNCLRWYNQEDSCLLTYLTHLKWYLKLLIK